MLTYSRIVVLLHMQEQEQSFKGYIQIGIYRNMSLTFPTTMFRYLLVPISMFPFSGTASLDLRKAGTVTVGTITALVYTPKSTQSWDAEGNIVAGTFTGSSRGVGYRKGIVRGKIGSRYKREGCYIHCQQSQ